MKSMSKSSLRIAALVLGAGLNGVLVSSCEDKPRTLGESVGDALDTRPNENLKDAGEDLKDAVKDAKDEIKDEIKR